MDPGPLNSTNQISEPFRGGRSEKRENKSAANVHNVRTINGQTINCRGLSETDMGMDRSASEKYF